MTNANYRIEKMEITSEENNHRYGIALGHNEKSGMWVTWCFKANIQDKDNIDIDYFWGHYFDRETDALIDYCRRVINELE